MGRLFIRQTSTNDYFKKINMCFVFVQYNTHLIYKILKSIKTTTNQLPLKEFQLINHVDQFCRERSLVHDVIFFNDSKLNILQVFFF